MLWIVGLLIFSLFLIVIIKESKMWSDDEIVETVITEETPNIVGNLKRLIEGKQSFVLDPVDKEKIYLNNNDDMYEDANGKIWRLV